jgi:hypothetical protein
VNGKITASSGISIALTVVLLGMTWSLFGAVTDFRVEMERKYMSQEVGDLRFERIEEKLDEILKNQEKMNARIGDLEKGR